MLSKPDIQELVTPTWLQANVHNLNENYGINTNDLAAITGVDRTQISAWVNGSRNMSAAVKAMFYFLFKSLNIIA